MRRSPRKALIIGAGIAGPVAALFLKRAGIDAAVYEAWPYATGIGGGLQIAPNGMHVLAELGLAEEMIGRGAVASEMVGLSEEVFGRTVAYLKDRKQFGKAIGEFQALQHRAAQLYIDIEITRAAVLKALQALDADATNAATAVAVAKARAGTTATRAVQEGVQMHGGMGMTDQFDIGFFMKRARVCQELFGDSNFHADQLARMKNY